MSSVAFLVALIGMVIIVRWAITNDQAGDSGRTTGLLAMKEPNVAPEPAPGRRQRRERPEKAGRATADRAPSGPAADSPIEWTVGDAVGADFSIAQVKLQGPSAATATEDDAAEINRTPPAPRRRVSVRTRRPR